jgi:ribosomal protein S18 acetylase RimI-like enzyme
MLGAVRVVEHSGPRAELRWLFEQAEDSAQELDGYIDAGRVLVALEGDEIVGHLQLTDMTDPAEAEVKNMAVDPGRLRRGIGRALMEAAFEAAREAGRSRIVVATAAASIGNLRFYQRLGFRLHSVERDAFTPATGYEPGLLIDGIELRDRVWLDRRLVG